MAGQTAVLSDLKVFINTQPLVEAGKLGEKSMGKLSSKMRMLGRDVLRLGGLVSRYGMWFDKAFKSMTESSLDLGGAVEDISWAFEDIGAVLGDVLAPTFEWLADIMDTIADIFEAMPDWMKGAIAGFILFGFIGMKIARVVMDLAGLFWLLKGSFLGTSKEVSGLWANIGKLFPFFKKASEGTEALTLVSEKLAAKQLELGQATVKWNEALLMGSKDAGKMGAKVQTLKDEILTLSKEQKAMVEGEEKGMKAKKKAGKGIKGWAGTIGKAVATMGIFAGIMLVLGPVIEMLSPIFEAIGDAMESFLEPLEPIIEAIADWIEENPELAASLIIGVVGALTALLLLKHPILNFLTGVVDKGTGMIGMAKSGGTEILKLALAIAIVALALTPLILAFTHFLVQMKEHNITIPEVIGYLFSLGGAIVFLIGILMVVAYVATAAGIGLGILAVVLLAAGAAALMFGYGIMLAGKGIEYASKGLLSLVNYLPQVILLIPAIFGLAMAMSTLGGALLLALPGMFLGAVGLTALAAGIALVAGAVFLLAGALASIPSWARGFIAPVGAVVGKFLGGIPVLQEGGIVTEAGIAYLEPAEVVTPAGERGPGGAGTIYNTFYITATIREESDIDKLAQKVSEKQAESYAGRVYT